MDFLLLNDKKKNRLPFTWGADLTNLQVIFRAKNSVENTTTPIIQLLAVISSVSSTSSIGYFDIDLTANTTLTDNSYFEIEINNATTINGVPTIPPVFPDNQPFKIRLITRLG